MNIVSETNLIHNLSSVYSIVVPLHVSGLLVAHHQEVTVYICDSWYVLYVLVDTSTRPADSQLKRTICTIRCIYTLLTPDDGLLASPKHVEVQRWNKLKINCVSSWFHYMHISKCTVKKNLGKIALCFSTYGQKDCGSSEVQNQAL
jgi:hypothetical protein